MKGEPEDLRPRTRRFGLDIIALSVRVPRTQEGLVMSRQLLRSGTSVGAQYREACRARSDAEFVSKIESALQELDESAYWLELLIDSNVCSNEQCQQLLAEADELIRIFVTIARKRKGR